MFGSIEFGAIVNELLAALVAFILGLTAKSTYDAFLRRHPARKFWGDFIKSSDIIVSSPPDNYDETSLHTGFSDLKAAAKVAALLSHFTDQQEGIKLIEANYIHGSLSKNIVLIGGPITNSITQRVMDDASIPFSFENHHLINKKKHKEYKPRLDESGKVIEDYAFILKLKNLFDERYGLIILAGCYGYGTYAAAKAVTDFQILRKINNNNFGQEGIIIKTNIVNDVPQRPLIVDMFDY